MRKRIVYVILVLGLSIFVFWDLYKSVKASMVAGTFRLESEFPSSTALTTKVAIVPSDYSGLSSPIPRNVNPTYAQIEDMVREAIELQGGLGGVVTGGDTVMIKVNLVGGSSGSGDGENTDVRVVKSLIKILDDHTAGNVVIIVAEGTARTNDDPTATGSVWDISGYMDLATDTYLSGIDFSLFNLNQGLDDMVEVDLGDEGTAAPHGYIYHVHKKELEADVFITVPVLKIHDTGITNALKNQIGTAPGCYYGYNKMAGVTNVSDGLYHDVDQRRWTTEEIVDLCNIADIDFVVVDAIMCLEEYKSYDPSRQVRMNTIVAGIDPVAVDHVCAKLFGVNPDDVAHITLAEKVGLGTNNPDKIQMEGASINDVMKRVKQNPTENGKFGQSNRTWLLSQTYAGSISTEHIPGENTLEPVSGVDGWSQPVYFFDDRIDLFSYYNDPSGVVTYAFTYFSAPQAQQAVLQVGSDESMYVFLNGVLVYSWVGLRTYSENSNYIENDSAHINILEGVNTLMVKTYQEYGDYSFALNICEPPVAIPHIIEANRVAGLQFFTENYVDYPPEEVLFMHDGIDENLAINELAGRLSVSDRNIDDTYSFSFEAGEGDVHNTWFIISGDSVLCNHAIDYETLDTIRIRVTAVDTDTSDNSRTEMLAIPVNNVNEPPLDISMDNTEVNEGLPVGTIVGNLSTNDIDEDDFHSYSLVSGTGSDDNNSFSISGSTLCTKEIFDFESKSSYSILIRSQDAGGLTIDSNIIIHILDVSPENIAHSGLQEICLIYPNPFIDKLHVKIKNNKLINAIHIIDISGKTVFSSNAIDHQEAVINTSLLKYGIYVLRIDIEGKIYRTAVIKQKR